ncbi:MAG: hypothetical protein WAV09_00935 [Minisyncoccia bacterium]
MEKKVEKLTGKQIAIIVLFVLIIGAIGGGAFVFACEWGAYSNLMSRAVEASKHGDGFAIFDATQEDGMPVLVSKVVLVHMVDLKLRETQNLEQACREHDATPSRDLIPEGEYRGPQDVPRVVAVFQ